MYLISDNIMLYIAGGAFEGVEDKVSPFGYGRGEGADAGHGDPDWICSKDKPRTDEIFRSLNPVDGKVTGAGMLHLTLHALLDNTRLCSHIAGLCTDDNPERSRAFEVLTLATQNNGMIVRFLEDIRTEMSRRTSTPVSSRVSIHSLETLALGNTSRSSGPDDSTGLGFECFDDEDGPETRRTGDTPDPVEPDIDRETSSDSEIEDLPHLTPAPAPLEPERESIFRSIYVSIKFLVVLVVNVIVWVIVVEVMFKSMVYCVTGELFIQFTVDESADSWLAQAKRVVFGPQLATVRINTFFELFHRHNIVSILKYLITCLRNGNP